MVPSKRSLKKTAVLLEKLKSKGHITEKDGKFYAVSTNPPISPIERLGMEVQKGPVSIKRLAEIGGETEREVERFIKRYAKNYKGVKIVKIGKEKVVFVPPHKPGYSKALTKKKRFS